MPFRDHRGSYIGNAARTGIEPMESTTIIFRGHLFPGITLQHHLVQLRSTCSHSSDDGPEIMKVSS